MTEEIYPAAHRDGAADQYLITGSTGFIGRRVQAALIRRGDVCRVLLRHGGGSQAVPVVQGDLADVPALDAACAGIDCVIHCAGHAHAFAARSADEARQHWQINFEGTRNLVEAAGRAGVRRFVFLSSVKAMAEPGEVRADEDFLGEPDSDYGRAKRAAETAVLAAAERYGMQAVNLRLSMVYGAGGRGNLERMGRLVGRGLFPPLPETGNRRSLVHVDDVVAAILAVTADPRAAGRTYIVCGPEAPSGRQLFDALRAASGLSPCHRECPRGLLQLAAWLGDGWGRIFGRRLPLTGEVLQRLLGSACYDGSRISREIGWRPTVRLADGLREMLRK
ncbi:MAG: NAD-dependent epimerase/dehydratase family protein [Azonexus sp.]|jgi:nucleoside-diphosphate-sugar epimerase|uniref:NAD-dependent epimerase/dehydratase family protein n=1 Tax=Azonexus sp. TaxID=1872668 RepID=UPI00282416D2|nr:NAD-dependent epimerase/dehydratase family protein [Azonexus sp.]MDR0777386.1 NAD-dependent epimerase/dehydratase family protein [Azonexus sp.]